jgi:ketosteroid isomerase-like protein
MTPTIEQRLRVIEDELAIRNLAARFSDCANERDYYTFADLWSARGIWEIGPPLPARAEGVDAIVKMLERLLAPQTSFMQMTHSGVVWLDGDRATARFVEREHGRGEASYYENLAVYNDALAREADGKWRFVSRRYVYRYLDDSEFTGQVFPLGGAGDPVGVRS